MRIIKKYIKNILRFIGLLKFQSKWPKVSEKRKIYFKNNIALKTSIETINDIKRTIEAKERGAYLRFGDGDIFLMLGLDDMLHEKSKDIAKEMTEAFQFKGANIHKALAIHSNLYGFEKGMKNDMHLISDQKATTYLSVTYKYLNLNQIYTPIALHYLATFCQSSCVDFLTFLRKTNPVFVGNEKIKPELIKSLFGGEHIKTPSENSYFEIDRIEKELIEALDGFKGQFKVVVVAMGCPGRILQKRILKKGYNVYLFDFGSLLDAFNGEKSRLWIDLAGIDNLNKILDKLR